MKVAINLVGISKGHRNRDWANQAQNIKKNLIDVLSEEHDVNLYITTYPHDTIDELISFYQPKKTNILPIENSDQRLTYISSLMQILNEDVDFIISTRFDIFFRKPYSEFQNIDYTKINFLFRENCWWEKHNFVCDNFFIFPKKYLKQFIDAVQKTYDNPVRPSSTDMHQIYSCLKETMPDELIFLSETQQASNKNEFYHLNRV